MTLIEKYLFFNQVGLQTVSTHLMNISLYLHIPSAPIAAPAASPPPPAWRHPGSRETGREARPTRGNESAARNSARLFWAPIPRNGAARV